jgi:hypothetical protein
MLKLALILLVVVGVSGGVAASATGPSHQASGGLAPSDAEPARASAERVAGAGGPLRLVFNSTRGDGSWFAMNADGSDLRALKPPFDTAVEVRWSPDGSHLAYIGGGPNTPPEPGPNAWLGPLFLMRSDGTGRVRVATEVGGFAWSLSGRWLAGWDESERFVTFASSDGRPAGRLRLERGEEFVGWAPGDRIMLTVGHALVIAGRRGGHRVALSGAYGLETATPTLAWSPVGGRLAFAAGEGGREQMLCLVNADNSGRRCLTSITGFAIDPIAWSPRGDRVAFTRHPASHKPELWVLDVATMRARAILRPASGPDELTWSPDGSKIAAAVGDGGTKGDIWVLRPDGSQLRKIVSTGYDDSPRWVPASRLAPFEGEPLPGVPAPFRVVDARTLIVRRVAQELAVDGASVAVHTTGLPDGNDVAVWTPATREVQWVPGELGAGGSPEQDWSSLALAGKVAAWIQTYHQLHDHASIITSQRGLALGPLEAETDDDGGGDFIGHLAGGGGVLAWNVWEQRGENLSTMTSAELGVWDGKTDRTVRRGLDSFQAVDVDQGRILVLHPDGSLLVLNMDGAILRRLNPAADTAAAALDGDHVVTLGGGTLRQLNISTGAVEQTWTVPADAKLAGASRGIAALLNGPSISLIDLASGRTIPITPEGKQPALATLDVAGLVTASVTGKQTTVRLLPVAALKKLLPRAPK